jgi:Family of unknown function (DUF5681)
MSGKKRRPTGRYRVGYCKPPKRTQFKRGTSGNPKGRKKGSRNKVGPHLPVDKLRQLMTDKRVPAAVQLKAAQIMIQLAVGMVVQED